MSSRGATAAASFTFDEGRAAIEPPEARGLERDEVRLLVAGSGHLHHSRFRDVGSWLRAGDLLVVNTSTTLPAAVDGRRRKQPVVVHFSSQLDDGTWVVELRLPDGSGPVLDAVEGEAVALRGGGMIELLAGHVRIETGSRRRLWRACVQVSQDVESFLAANGRPISYGYLRAQWPLEAYQTVFARHPGSAEMPSAARPFTHRLVTELVTGGVTLAPILLHAGVSSLETHELPQAERFRVPAPTARLVELTRRNGGRVIAVGTTATRALETVSRGDGTVEAGAGWTDLILGPDRPARVVDGLVTGWHPPGASHLLLLEAIAGAELVREAYDAALESNYLWHEFGDSCLLLPQHV